MTVEEIRELINLAKETGVAVLEVQRGENRVRIRTSGNPLPVATRPYLPSQPVEVAAAPAAAPPAETKEKAPDNLALVKSPIVGTFYEAPSPGAPPFVRVGEKVQPGKVLCIIESMKLMNEIEAEISGVIESKLVLNGQPVEYGEALFAVRPV